MTAEILLMGLAGITLVAVMIFALTSKVRVEQRKSDTRASKSRLASDVPNK